MLQWPTTTTTPTTTTESNQNGSLSELNPDRKCLRPDFEGARDNSNVSKVTAVKCEMRLITPEPEVHDGRHPQVKQFT